MVCSHFVLLTSYFVLRFGVCGVAVSARLAVNQKVTVQLRSDTLKQDEEARDLASS